jgi:hypothetical protein
MTGAWEVSTAEGYRRKNLELSERMKLCCVAQENKYSKGLPILKNRAGGRQKVKMRLQSRLITVDKIKVVVRDGKLLFQDLEGRIVPVAGTTGPCHDVCLIFF